MLFNQFYESGHNLFERGLVEPNTGNISVRQGDRLIIKRSGAHMGNLREEDLVETGIFEDDDTTAAASMELPVHRSIYRTTTAQAVVHAHPPCAVALSLGMKDIVPENANELSVIGRVPVVGWGSDVRPGAFDDIIAEALKDHVIVMVYGHGSFAVGQTIDEAYRYTIVFEEVCRAFVHTA